MSRSHNKKRNSGLLYEFLVAGVSRGVVSGDDRASRACLRLIKRHFRPGTELHKELRLVNALVRTTVSNQHVAASIMQEAKAAARSHDAARLDREKSLLIDAINKSVNDGAFFDQPVSGYRTFATVQTLVNEWRSGAANLSLLAEYEGRLSEWLVSEKPRVDGGAVDLEPAEGVPTRLLVKSMMQKLNERYSGRSMLAGQRELLRAYALSQATSSGADGLRSRLVARRDALLESIDAHLSEEPGGRDGYVGRKLAEVREMVAGESLSAVDDPTVTRFMLYDRLSHELAVDAAGGER